MSRLPHIKGELIDRGAPLEFIFEGRRVHAYRGDTISSALAASAVRIVGRSFKYHRPRGLLSLAGHDVNALMQVRRDKRSIPNIRADIVPVQPGWQISATNTRGGLTHDRLAAFDFLGRFLPVGFYYKAFHGKRLFPYWERVFRYLTGLGEVDTHASREHTPKRYEFCDVLVVGAGPSGLAAALAAAERGASTLLVDENGAEGGSGQYARAGSTASADKTAALVAAVRANPRIQVLTSTYAAGYYPDHWVALVAPECMIKARARAVIVAQGAYEQPAVFRGNDLPGVMLASAGQRLLYRYAVVATRRLAVITANAEGYGAALDALEHGVELVAVLDLREQPGAVSRPLADKLTKRGVQLYCGVSPIEAIARSGGELGGLVFESSAAIAPGRRQIELDGLWMSVGFSPANALLHQANARMGYVRELEQFVPKTLPAGIYACGKVNGVYSFEERIADGRAAGTRAADTCAAGGLGSGRQPPDRAAAGPVECPTHPYPIFPHPRGKEFVDFDEDLQVKDLENACQEGFDSSELLKRFSTVGMGPSQGKHSNMNALRILARLRGESIEQLGTTTARPMFHPVPLSHLAGRGFTAERRTPLDSEHEALGAVWMPAGNWRRPEYYAVAGKSRDDVIADEVRAVRVGVGLIDVGTLGKIQAHGPDAALFLERVYTGRFADLKVGMTRYALMLDDAGVIVDDGVVGRLGPQTFYFTTTTGNSATVFRELGRLATWWGLSVGLVNLTGQYAALNLAGPAAREVLAEHTALDLSDKVFPYVGIREAQIAGAPCIIMRAGFVGETAYEIHLAARYAAYVWRSLMSSGARFGIRPFGVEAQRALRLEKGHIIVGQDTDGVTNALEIGAPWALKMEKPFFVGQRSLRILEKQPPRQTLVAFSLPAGESRPKEGHLVIDGSQIAGRVTSIVWSATLSRWIGLALVRPAQAARGKLRIRIEKGEEIEVDIVQRPFYDPNGDRQRMADPDSSAASNMPRSAAQTEVGPSSLDGDLQGLLLLRRSSGASGNTCPSVRVEILSNRQRFGCKGPGAEAWLSGEGYRVPPDTNSALVAGDGVLVARLATSEFLVEALDTRGERVKSTRLGLESAEHPNVYPVPREDLVIDLHGAAVGVLLREMCSVDFLPLLDTAGSDAGPVVLTSMIGVAVTALPRRVEGRGALTLWLDRSFAHYFLTTLFEVADGHGGAVVHQSTGT